MKKKTVKKWTIKNVRDSAIAIYARKFRITKKKAEKILREIL